MKIQITHNKIRLYCKDEKWYANSVTCENWLRNLSNKHENLRMFK